MRCEVCGKRNGTPRGGVVLCGLCQRAERARTWEAGLRDVRVDSTGQVQRARRSGRGVVEFGMRRIERHIESQERALAGAGA